MKFRYQFKTSDGERHDGEISAASREAVFVELKKKGIKPYGVVLAPGFLNRLCAIGKRTYAIVFLSAVCLALVFALRSQLATRRNPADALIAPRQQIYGDPAILRQCESRAWRNVFTNALDVLLASYAIPGRAVDFAQTRELAAQVALPAPLSQLVDYPRPLASRPDSPEIASMRRMVNWMRRELFDYLSAGGKFADYVLRLRQRQADECQMRERINVELQEISRRMGDYQTREAFESAWEEKNEVLRTMGILPFPIPD